MRALGFIFFIFIVIAGCQSTYIDDDDLESALVGTWTGNYSGDKGAIKSWRQIRRPDGTYIIFFSKPKFGGGFVEFSESGKWWIKDGMFHEMTPTRTEPEVYEYNFYTKNCLRFSVITFGENVDGSEGYTFTECRSKQKPLTHHST